MQSLRGVGSIDDVEVEPVLGPPLLPGLAALNGLELCLVDIVDALIGDVSLAGGEVILYSSRWSVMLFFSCLATTVVG